MEITLSGSTVGVGAAVGGNKASPVDSIVREPAASVVPKVAVTTALPASRTIASPFSLMVTTDSSDEEKLK